MTRLFGIIAALVMASLTAAHAETRLAMAEEVGCFWCTQWNAEIGPIYPLTPEGEAAPLLRFDKNQSLPEGVTLARPVLFTPTFILLVDGQEVQRLEGYPGEDFFWGLITQMMEREGVL